MDNTSGFHSLVGKVKSLLNTSTLKKSSITFAGTVVNAVLGAVFYILTARYLGPSGFGIMTVALTVLTLTADMSDLGTNTGIVNFVSRYIKRKKIRAYRYLKLGLQVKLTVGLIVMILGVLLSSYIAGNVFAKPELTDPLQIAFAGVMTLLVFSFIVSALQSFQRFWSWSAIQIATNLLRLLLFATVFYAGFRSIEATLIVYVMVPLIGFIAGLYVIGIDFLKVKGEWKVANQFFRYNGWAAAFAIFAAIGARMDTFITARLLDSSEVGIYSAANQMVKIVPQIVIALGTVIGPKMAQLTTFNDFMKYLKKTQAMVFVLAVMGLMTIPVVIYLIPYIFGTQYIPAEPVFVVLFLAMLIFLISVPIHMAVFYYYSFPKLFFITAVLHFILVTTVGYFAVSGFGVMGAAYTVLIAQVLDLVVPGVFVLSKIQRKESKKNVDMD